VSGAPVPATAPAEPLTPEPLTPFKRGLAASIRAVARSLARVRVVGAEALPREGPLIVVANHLSNLDPILVAAWLQPALGRPIHFMAKEQLFRWPLAPLLRAYGTILVRAGGRDVEAYRAGLDVLERGGVLGIFPEGTRSRSGAMQEALPGAAMLALRGGVPILPVGLTGTDRLLGRGSWIPRIGCRVTIRVGQPFRLDAGTPVAGSSAPAPDRRAAIHAGTDRIMSSIAALLPQDRPGSPT
jgi:1-acyl-sn-glycerol-3-phosphate acyltransferase